MAVNKLTIRCGRDYVHENTLKKARIVAEIVKEHYEPGRHDRCLYWIYKNIVYKQYPMSLRTFHRYLDMAKTYYGYSFTVKSTDKRYLFDIYDKMSPESILTVKDICREAQKIKHSKKIDLCCDLQERLGLTFSLNQINLYLLVGQHCMGYNI